MLLSGTIFVLIMLVISYKITHKAVGPFERIIRELEERIKGTAEGEMKVRKGDKFEPLVKRINLLLEKKKKTERSGLL